LYDVVEERDFQRICKGDKNTLYREEYLECISTKIEDRNLINTECTADKGSLQPLADGREVLISKASKL
jgi:hypothetical protein